MGHGNNVVLRDASAGQSQQGVQRGDIMFYAWPIDGWSTVPYATHTGYVLGTDDSGFWVLEGNAGGTVALFHHSYYFDHTRGWATPAYY